MVIGALLLGLLPLSNSKLPLNGLQVGANITRWFCYLGPGDQSDHFRNYLTDLDLAEFKRLNYTYVRLCISPDTIYKGGEAIDGTLTQIDTAVERLNRSGLTVIWDLHDNGQLKIDQPGSDQPGFVHFWQSVARHYKGRKESSLVFELLNEPVFQKNPDDWYLLQSRTVKEIRKVDSSRTIMVSPTSWSSIDQLVKMNPLEEKNLIYTFHCYDPFFFTHQGAEWVGEYPGKFKSIPFPASTGEVDKILPENEDRFHGALQDYGRAGYDDQYLKTRIAMAADWGKAHRVPVLLGEFGAYPKVSPPESRARWFVGIRKAIEAANVPSALWGYDDGLGLGRTMSSEGHLQLDPVTLKNLYQQ